VSNRIEIIQGTSLSQPVDLVDINGEPLSLDALVGATAELLVRADPAVAVNAIQFTSTANPTSLVFAVNEAVLTASFVPTDTSGLLVKEYFFQLTVTFANGDVDVMIPWAPFDVVLGGSATPAPPTFDNTVKIDENFRLPNDLAYVSPAGSPIENAQVRVYLKSDYDAGKLDTPVGFTTTNAFGGWINPILVKPGFTYVARFEKPYEWGPNTQEFFA
jgi:hypothetical protein